MTGYLVLDQPWPSMLRGIWGDPERFKETYWSRYAEQGWYFAGDGARVDSDGNIWVLGRIDDVMNVSGPPDLHRPRWSRRWSVTPAWPRRRSSAPPTSTTGQAHLRVRHPRGARHSDTRRHGRRAARARSPRRSDRSPGRARFTSCRSCPRPAAARSCAGCCVMSPKVANSATRQRCWIPACSRRSGPASSEKSGRGRTDRDEARARSVLGGDVGQHGR